MTWTHDDVDALREGWDFEAKKAGGRDGRGQVPADFWPTYSAMANTRGGKVVLGLKERKDGTFAVHGIADPDKVERDLWNELTNPQKASTNVLSRNDVHQETIDGSVILVIDIPRARRNDRPVFINGDLWRGTYLRIHDGDRHASRDRIRLMVADAEFDSRDERVLERFTLDDLDRETIRAYRTIFGNRRPDHPWLPLADETFLRRLNALGYDREQEKTCLTAAGLLMFGRHETIRDKFPFYFLDYQERLVGTGAIEWSDRIFPDGAWSGNVFDFYRKVILKLTADLKVPFKLETDLSRRDDTHVHEAVREALINALIHADYEGRIAILVVKDPTGFEVRNPGGLRLPVEEIRAGGHSDCRNRLMQRMFLMLGLGEQAGSGFSRILRAWQEQHWQIPNLRENFELDTTTLRLSTASFVPQETLDDLRDRFPEFPGLDEVARLTLATAAIEGRVTNRRMQELSSRHPHDLTMMFRGLVADGMLVSHGERSGTWYTVAGEEGSRSGDTSDQSGASIDRGIDQSSAGIDQSIDQSSDGIDQSVSSDQRFDQASGQSSPTPSQSSRTPAQTPSQSSQSPSQSSIDSLVRVAGSRWASRSAVRKAILQICRDRFRTSREIAERLNRARGTILRNYIPALVSEGLLELKDPSAPRHPDQAYRTTAKDHR